MDYRDQDGNGEGLYGARNENSVLFSLDSLTSLDNDSSANPSGSGFGSSGDASGLIDLNTLAKMSNSGGTEDNGEPDTSAMKSVVFNNVVAKKTKHKWIAVIACFVVVLLVAGGIIYYVTSDFEEKARQEAELQAAKDKKAAEEAEARQAEIDRLQQEIEQAKADAKKRDVDSAAVQKELEKLQAQKEALMANGAADSGDSKDKKKSTKSGNSGSNSGSDSAAPAPAKTKAPDKGELLAALKAANTKAQKCGKGGNLSVSFNLSNNEAKGVKSAGGSFAGTATEKCILTVVSKNRWPDGTASGIKYNFKL